MPLQHAPIYPPPEEHLGAELQTIPIEEWHGGDPDAVRVDQERKPVHGAGRRRRRNNQEQLQHRQQTQHTKRAPSYGADDEAYIR